MTSRRVSLSVIRASTSRVLMERAIRPPITRHLIRSSAMPRATKPSLQPSRPRDDEAVVCVLPPPLCKKKIKSDNSLRGYFTGHNHSEAEQSGFALPLQAEWQATKRFSITTGPVFEYYIQRQFSGSVTDGYLRVDVPTGNKVLFGAMGENSPTYDFSNDMSRFGLGWQLGLAYRFATKWQAYALGRYIFTNTFEPKFETINMRLHPVYLTLGLAYQIKL